MAWNDQEPFGGLFSRFGALHPSLQPSSLPICELLIKLIICWLGASRSLSEKPFIRHWSPSNLAPGILNLCIEDSKEPLDKLDDAVGAHTSDLTPHTSHLRPHTSHLTPLHSNTMLESLMLELTMRRGGVVCMCLSICVCAHRLECQQESFTSSIR